MISSEFKITSAGFTHLGHRRSVNEDHYLCLDDQHLYAVADGLGGLPGGRLASEQAIERLALLFSGTADPKFTPDQEGWIRLWSDLHQQLEFLAEERGYEHQIGTTLTILYLDGATAWWSHLGDSRLYLLRNGQLTSLTSDHTMLEQYQRNPDHPDVRNMTPSQMRHMLTRCLGNRDDEPIPVGSHEILPKDRYLLCSDGVWDAIPENLITTALSDASSPAQAVQILEQQALSLGGDDNLAAVAVYVA